MSNTTTKHDEEVAPLEAWDAIAAGYDRYVTPGEAELATKALKLAGLERGHHFLDVAAGTGGLSIPAARMGARVVATDWSPKMIERFEARVRELAIPDATGRVMDCHELDFADDAFDVTGSQFGVMLVANQAGALREMVRVTKPGGRVLVIAYGSPCGFEALQWFASALEEANPDFPGLAAGPEPLEFQVADPAVLEARLVDAGLGSVEVHTSYQERIEVRTGQELWDWCLGGNPIPGMLVADLSDAQKATLKSVLDARIRERAGDDGVAVLTAPLNIGVGTK